MPPLVPLLLALVAVAHPDSLSRSRLVVEGAEARLALRFQELSLLEIFPELDLDRDGRLGPAELEGARAPIEAYLSGHWRLLDAAGTPLAIGELVRLGPASGTDGLWLGAGEAPTPVGPAAERGAALGWVEAELRYRAAAPFEVFTLDSSLFREESPDHRDVVSLRFGDEPEFYLPFHRGPFRWTFEPSHVRRPGVLRTFLRLGYEHIRDGYDHLAFLLALLVAARRLRDLVGVVTAFTLAHSVTLALTALQPGGWLDRIPDRLVELSIALSIAYVATDNLLRRAARNGWVEAFAFGLLHGLGFAGFLEDALAAEPLVVTALFGFNLGVELGQLLVVLVVGGALVLIGRSRGVRPDAEVEERPPGLAPAWLRAGVSALVALLGFGWFLERAGWVELPGWWI